MPSSALALAVPPSSPPRRSSDLRHPAVHAQIEVRQDKDRSLQLLGKIEGFNGDRKSTRLNSSHLGISYALFRSSTSRPPLFPSTTLFRSPTSSCSCPDRGPTGQRPEFATARQDRRLQWRIRNTPSPSPAAASRAWYRRGTVPRRS